MRLLTADLGTQFKMATTRRQVAQRFVIGDALGHGGMGTVWRAEDQILQRSVALKEVHLPPSLPESERQAMRERVLREARAAARLNHPGAVTIFDVLEEDGNTYIAMELVEAPTLAALVKEQGPLSADQAASIGLAVLDALEAAHAEGIVHRDVKPANVIVGADGRVKLADFGIASVKGDPKLTASGLILGSPSYMSPEQADGKSAGPASDLWALGATMYFAVEGRGPFEKGEPLPTLVAIVNEQPSPPKQSGPLSEAIMAMLQKDPAKRPGPEELRPMLQDARAGGPKANGGANPIGLALPATEPASAAVETAQTSHAAAPAPASRAVETAPPARPSETAPVAPTAQAPPSAPPAQRDETDPGTTMRDSSNEVATAVDSEASGPAPTQPQQSIRHVQSTPDAVTGKSGRFQWAWVLAGLALLLVVVFALLPGAETEPPAPREQANDSSQTQPRQSEQTAEEGSSAGSANTALPAGWRNHTVGDTGYRIGFPSGWRVRENVLGDGTSVRFQDRSGRYLLLDWTNEPGDDAAAAWREQAPGFASRHGKYREIRIEPTEFQNFDTAAIWEYTYSSGEASLHAVNLGFADDEWGFALNFQTRAGDWESSQRLFEQFKQSFGPTGS